jgi:hypothetical protein
MATETAAPREDDRKEGDVETVDLGRGSAEGSEGEANKPKARWAYDQDLKWTCLDPEEDMAQKEARDTAQTGDYPNEEDIEDAGEAAVRDRILAQSSGDDDSWSRAAADVLGGVQNVQGESIIVERISCELWELRCSLEGFEARDLVSAECRDVPIPIPAAALLLSKREELQRAMAEMREKMVELEEFVGALDRSTILPETSEHSVRDAESSFVDMEDLRVAIELGREEERAEKPVDLDERRPPPSFPEVDEGGIMPPPRPQPSEPFGKTRGWWR